MIILGLNFQGYDTSAAILKDGEIVAAAQQERFNGEKRTRVFPQDAIRFCLQHAGISFDELHAVAVGWNPGRNIDRVDVAASGRARHRGEFLYSVPNMLMGFKNDRDIHHIYQQVLFENSPDMHIHYIDHHRCHAAFGFYMSDFENAHILSADAYGEKTSTWIGYGTKDGMFEQKQVIFPYSLGSFYATITEFLGFPSDSDEYKVMGMAAYGNPVYKKALTDLFTFSEDGLFETDLSYFCYYQSRPEKYTQKLITLLGEPRKKGDEYEQRHFDIARSLQDAFSELLIEIIKENGLFPNLIYTGGTALNCLAASEILAHTPVENLYIPYAPDDCGIAVGAALELYYTLSRHPRRYHNSSPYMGPSFSAEEIKKFLDNSKLRYECPVNIADKIAKTVASGKTTAVLTGRMEFGARALGNRSIFANPAIAEIKDIINSQIKFREYFRPFAASIKEEAAAEFFHVCDSSPYMKKTYMVRDEKKNAVSGVIHKDGSCRIQTVNKKQNPRFWNILDAFEKHTGLPLMLNTSFNVAGQPMVCNPQQAVQTFFSSGLDSLVMESVWMEK